MPANSKKRLAGRINFLKSKKSRIKVEQKEPYLKDAGI